MRVGLFQGPAEAVSKTQALRVLARAAARAAADGAGLLVLPELFLTGYHIGKDALHGLAEAVDGPSSALAAAIAAECGVALLYGYPEREGGQVYNSALLLGRDGMRLANYRKTHLWGEMERAVFTPGSTPFVLAEVHGIRVGLLICYDMEFPEMVRGLAVHGADLVAVPTANGHPYAFVPETLVRARAYENQMFVAYANRCGVEGDLHHTGLSCIAGPDGGVLARAGAGEDYVSAQIDPALRGHLNSFLRDRRPELYGRLAAPDDPPGPPHPAPT